MLNTNKIKGRLAELGMNQKDVANSLGIAQATASQKINNVRSMDIVEAEKLSELLQISVDEYGVYFFWNDSCAMQQKE